MFPRAKTPVTSPLSQSLSKVENTVIYPGLLFTIISVINEGKTPLISILKRHLPIWLQAANLQILFRVHFPFVHKLTLELVLPTIKKILF